MNRRQTLRLLGGAATLLLGAPARLFAETPDGLANRAQDALASGNAAKALPLLMEAQTKDPRNDRVQALLGRTYFQQGDPRRALTHFQIAVRINPEDTLSRMMVETISQFPLPKSPAAEKDRSRGRPASPLVGEAEAERQELARHGASLRRSGPFRLLIDPGHGGSDSGGTGEGPREADVTLDLALRLGRILAGSRDTLSLLYTRTADVTLPGWARAALAGFYGADGMVSLHAARVNQPRAAGVVVYSLAPAPSDAVAAAALTAENAAYGRQASFLGRGEQEFFVAATRQAAGGELARRGAVLAGSMAKALPASSPLPPRGTGKAPFHLLANAAAPAVLVEAGFLSHPDDRDVLASVNKRQALAQTLASAVLAGIDAVAGG
jgi:N-acetylmuramoyl-L-alanine amidase